jgi:anti-repressor protein
MKQELVTTPRVFERAGRVFASSLDVAEFCGKRHYNVLRDIDNLECPENFRRLNFEEGVYTLSSTGPQEHRYFDMTKDGFTFLVMGFTGKKAAEFKIRYIEAFNKMEDALRGPLRATLPDLSDPAVLLPLLIQQAKANEAAQAQLAAQQPAQRRRAQPGWWTSLRATSSRVSR